MTESGKRKFRDVKHRLMVLGEVFTVEKMNETPVGFSTHVADMAEPLVGRIESDSDEIERSRDEIECAREEIDRRNSGLEAANEAKQNDARAFWAPWQARFDRLTSDGMSDQDALNQVGEEIYHAGDGGEPYTPTYLRRRLYHRHRLP